MGHGTFPRNMDVGSQLGRIWEQTCRAGLWDTAQWGAGGDLALLHGDPKLHCVLGLGLARPHQADEEVGSEDAKLGVAQLVQRVPAGVWGGM